MQSRGVLTFCVAALAICGCICPVLATAQTTPDASVARAIGTVKTLQPGTLVVTADSGADVTAQISNATKIVRVAPGQKDLQNATPLQQQDLQTGDRVLVSGRTAADGHSIAAIRVVVMKQADVSAKQQHERDDWQKRGVGGLVTALDPATGSITISSGAMGGATKNISVRTTKATVLRRYAPDSIKFDDAKPAPLEQIKVGDQLRARGNRTGDEVEAEEIVSGTFRNIEGTVTTVDAQAGTMTVQDAILKKPVVVKVSSDSQMKTLPPEMAQRIAMRLKGGGAAGGNGQGQGQGGGGAASAGGQAAHAGGGSAAGGPNGGGAPDLQRFLGRLPNSTLADLHKGDAVMLVSTDGSDSGEVTAITLLAGVEPILTASPNRSMLLSPWSLGGQGAEGEGNQ
jgi:hypothetical protein